MTTAWSHLPNAVHIDRIIADVSINYDNWLLVHTNNSVTLDLIWFEAWDVAYKTGRAAVGDVVFTVLNAANDAIDSSYEVRRAANRSVVWRLVRSAILALIAWPDSVEYLSLPVDQVQVLSALGDPKATLLLPAIGVLSCVN